MSESLNSISKLSILFKLFRASPAALQHELSLQRKDKMLY